ncbi:hypothetical protein BDV98DRAFT_575086 [Pterulicium gracile]|uniref:Uncharacterized protein n=1 Tax=Pterulicium gracile TaxID=1884261 RepID=A0A5C3Q7A4_9AGAR|nr:hypothetical protein BDV98DRAFT_575086 [Pterula gracilis]
MPQVLQIAWVKSAAYAADPTKIGAIIRARYAKADGIVAYVSDRPQVGLQGENTPLMPFNSTFRRYKGTKGFCTRRTCLHQQCVHPLQLLAATYYRLLLTHSSRQSGTRRSSMTRSHRKPRATLTLSEITLIHLPALLASPSKEPSTNRSSPHPSSLLTTERSETVWAWRSLPPSARRCSPTRQSTFRPILSTIVASCARSRMSC